MKKLETMRDRALALAHEAVIFGRINGDRNGGLAQMFVTFAVAERDRQNRELLAVLRKRMPDAAKIGEIAAILDTDASDDDEPAARPAVEPRAEPTR